MFNTHGELSADNVQAALAQLVKYASAIENLQSSTHATSATSLSDEQRDEMIARALFDDEGKRALGQAMAVPIRKNLDYAGVGRKALVVDPLPQGVLPVYDTDIDVAATVISTQGAVPESRVYGDRVTVPEFTIVSHPTIKISEVKRRRFNIIDRAQQKARQEIQAREDENIFAALNFAADDELGGENTVQTLNDSTTTTQLARTGLLRLKRQVDNWDNVTAKFFMNINEFTDMLDWESAGAAGHSQVDPVTQRELIQSGLMGSIYAADIIVSKVVPRKQVFAMAEPEFVGVMPIRQDIEVIPADEPVQLKIGWVVSEEIGIGIVNPRGVATGYVED